MPDTVLVKDLKRDGTAHGRYLVLERQVRTARNGKTFIAAQICDSTGQIALKVWGGDAELAAGMAVGAVIELKGAAVKEFNKALQIEVEAGPNGELVLCEPGSCDMAAFLPTTAADRDQLWEIVKGAIAEVQSPAYHALLQAVFEGDRLGPLFRQVPAATRRHHAYVGGLLEHTARVVGLCRAAAQVYDGVDRDLLLTGALLHDIGKAETYSLQRGFDLTDEGRFFGHLMIGVQLVEKEIARLREQGGVRFSEQARRKLLHLLLSHHGIMEWGSPVEPLLVEACILHHADNMDAQTSKFVAAAKGVGERPGWVYDPSLGRTVFVGRDEGADDEPGDSAVDE